MIYTDSYFVASIISQNLATLQNKSDSEPKWCMWSNELLWPRTFYTNVYRVTDN